MPNTNAQAILIANTKIRRCADRAGQFYNLCKAYQAEATAENWTALFPNNAEVIMDGSDVDGRTPILNSDVAAFITFISTQIAAYEATSFTNRNLVMKIAPNPELLG